MPFLSHEARSLRVISVRSAFIPAANQTSQSNYRPIAIGSQSIGAPLNNSKQEQFQKKPKKSNCFILEIRPKYGNLHRPMNGQETVEESASHSSLTNINTTDASVDRVRVSKNCQTEHVYGHCNITLVFNSGYQMHEIPEGCYGDHCVNHHSCHERVVFCTHTLRVRTALYVHDVSFIKSHFTGNSECCFGLKCATCDFVLGWNP